MRRVGEVLGLPVYENSFCLQNNAFVIDTDKNSLLAPYRKPESPHIILISPNDGLEFLLERQTMIDAIALFLTDGVGGIQ